MIAHFLQAVADTAQTIPTSGPALVTYLSTLVAGALSGLVVKYLGLASAKIANMNELVRLALLAIISFAMLKLGILMGLTLPSNPLGASPVVIQSAVSGIIGWLAHKGMAAAGIATNAASTKG